MDLHFQPKYHCQTATYMGPVWTLTSSHESSNALAEQEMLTQAGCTVIWPGGHQVYADDSAFVICLLFVLAMFGMVVFACVSGPLFWVPGVLYLCWIGRSLARNLGDDSGEPVPLGKLLPRAFQALKA